MTSVKPWSAKTARTRRLKARSSLAGGTVVSTAGGRGSIESYPIMRPTSSTRSSLTETSLVARQEGTVTQNTPGAAVETPNARRSDEHTSELQSLRHLVCRLLLEKKK